MACLDLSPMHPAGNDQQPELKELHSLAWKVVEPIFMRDQQEAIDRFNELHEQTAVQTILGSGDVCALPRDQFPNGGGVAAILR